MSEKLKFYKGLEENLANITIELGAIYHCTDTGNTYIGVIDPEGEVLEDGTYPLKLDLYSTVSDIYISDDDEIEGGFELVNADTLGGFPADEYALKDYVYEKIDEINIDSYATKEEVNALTYEDIGAAPVGDYATKDDLNAIDFPVDSVNGKTGVVELIAEDVGAPTIEYAKKVGAPHNLLDNSYWRVPKEIINQRGAGGTYGAWGGYTIDRWFVGETAATITIAQNGITLKGPILQSVANHEKLAGKTITAAMKINGVVYCCSGVVTYTNAWHRIAQFGGNGFFISVNALDDNTLWFDVSGENGVTIEWAALYEGEYTAETLPEYQPKGYAAELAECQRYYRAFDRECIGNGYVAADGKAVLLHIPFTMRIPQPTVVWSDTLYCRVNGTDYTVTSTRVFNTDNCMRVALYASGMPAKHTAAVLGTSLFALSADL